MALRWARVRAQDLKKKGMTKKNILKRATLVSEIMVNSQYVLLRPRLDLNIIRVINMINLRTLLFYFRSYYVL